MNGKKGSVHIDLPKCVLQDTISDDYDNLINCFNKISEEDGVKNILDTKVERKINNYNLKFKLLNESIIGKNFKSISKIAEVINILRNLFYI